MQVKKLFIKAQLEDDSIVDVITPEDACLEFSKSLKTIYNYIYAGNVATVKGKQIYIVKDTLINYLASKSSKKIKK